LNLWRLMGIPQAPAPPHLYPQQLQLKLYQAFIFSIPILFSIILFLLFYLFYLKRRTPSLSSPPRVIQRSSSQATRYHVSSVSPLSIFLSHVPHACSKEKRKGRKTGAFLCFYVVLLKFSCVL
jgi:E3 ubiquitin-protein ligase ATL7/58/59